MINIMDKFSKNIFAKSYLKNSLVESRRGARELSIRDIAKILMEVFKRNEVKILVSDIIKELRKGVKIK